MNGMTIGEMLRACRGEWQGNKDTLDKTPVSVVTDSRQAGEGSLFLALRGERTDGHRYIPDVLRKGALAVLCEERGAAGEPRIVVPDTLAAMQQIAAASRKRWDIPFIGVTGSVGKTTAKEMLAAALSGKYSVFKTPGSMNGQIGIPVSLIGLHGDYDAAVIEMGVSLFGEMTRLTNMVQPDMAVFTNIGDAHLEALGDRPGVLRAKSEILQSMKNGAIICNSGHFNSEINIPWLEEHCVKKETIKPMVDEYTFEDGRTIILLAEGRLVNLSGAEGHPANVMDMSFANQALCAEYMVKHAAEMKPGCYVVPEEIDSEIASVKLATLGVEIDVLTEEQVAYLNSWNMGTV